jgi:hypothetical protein
MAYVDDLWQKYLRTHGNGQRFSAYRGKTRVFSDLFHEQEKKYDGSFVSLGDGTLWRKTCCGARGLHACSSDENVERVQETILYDACR